MNYNKILKSIAVGDKFSSDSEILIEAFILYIASNPDFKYNQSYFTDCIPDFKEAISSFADKLNVYKDIVKEISSNELPYTLKLVFDYVIQFNIPESLEPEFLQDENYRFCRTHKSNIIVKCVKTQDFKIEEYEYFIDKKIKANDLKEIILDKIYKL